MTRDSFAGGVRETRVGGGCVGEWRDVGSSVGCETSARIENQYCALLRLSAHLSTPQQVVIAQSVSQSRPALPRPPLRSTPACSASGASSPSPAATRRRSPPPLWPPPTAPSSSAPSRSSPSRGPSASRSSRRPTLVRVCSHPIPGKILHFLVPDL